jgi:tRNA(adenine34) deaminase
MISPSVFMEMALAEARGALDRGEFPVGCVIVHGEAVIASGSRQGSTGTIASETDHAEILALKQLEASAHAGRNELTLYCTLEPCLMCFGAILISGIRRIVFAYEDVMGGGTRCDLSRLPALYSSRPVSIVSHVLREKSLDLFRSFFSNPANTYWKDSLLSRYTLSAPSIAPAEDSGNDLNILPG